jgi:hypothetical protein
MSTKFQRRVEDFICEHCAAQVKGNGYTNHCPQCLWSKHVDIHPGDRASACGGMMEPVRLEGSTPHYRILHRCVSCGYERRNDVQAQDSATALTMLIEKIAS